MSTYELLTGTEPNTLKVCEHCLTAIESPEGHQPIINTLNYQFADEDVEWKCEWCGKTEICTLYEI